MSDMTPEQVEKELVYALMSAAGCMAGHSRDWSLHHRDAWLWGIICGWDSESLGEMQRQHSWSDEDVANLRVLRQSVAALTEHPHAD